MKNSALFALLITLLLLSACAQRDEQTTASVQADLAAIGEARQQLIDALIADDVEKIMDGLTSDHLTMPPNAPTPQTLDALRSWHERRIAEFTMDFVVSSPELEIGGDWAIDRYSSTVTFTPRDSGASIQIPSKGLWIWHHEPDGSWKLSRSIWNSDEPIPDNQ
jgi:ketosteroid isomerase-like protein